MFDDLEKSSKLIELLNIEYTWVDKLLHPFIWIWVRIEEKWHNLRYRCQRFKKGYSDRDVWEMQDWFVRTVKSVLQEFCARTYNHPEEIDEEQWREILWEMGVLLDVMDSWDDTAARKQAGLAPDDKSPEAFQLISAEKEKAKNRFSFCSISGLTICGIKTRLLRSETLCLLKQKHLRAFLH